MFWLKMIKLLGKSGLLICSTPLFMWLMGYGEILSGAFGPTSPWRRPRRMGTREPFLVSHPFYAVANRRLGYHLCSFKSKVNVGQHVDVDFALNLITVAGGELWTIVLHLTAMAGGF